MAAASATRTSTTETPRCGARTRSGGLCKQPAGAFTDHPGFGQCKWHGGATRNGKKSAAKLQALTLASELDMEPHDALLWCVRAAAGQVQFLARKVEELRAGKLLVTQKRERVAGEGDSYVERSNHVELHAWVRAHQDALDRLAKFAKMAVDAGVAERHVRIAERYGEVIARLLDGVLGDLGLTETQLERAPAVVQRHLVLLEGGAVA